MSKTFLKIGDYISLTGEITEIHADPNGFTFFVTPGELEPDDADRDNYKAEAPDEQAQSGCCQEVYKAKPPTNLSISPAVFADGAAVLKDLVAVAQTPQGQALIADLIKLAGDLGISATHLVN